MFNKPDTNGRKRVGEAVNKIERAAADRRTYRVLEIVAIVGTVAALLTTYFMLGRGASEMNPVASWLLEDPTSGSSDWFVVVAVGLIAVALSFAILRRYSHVAPRYVLAVATGAAAVHALNGLNDLYILATAGFPEYFIWSNASPVVGFTLLLAGLLAARHRIYSLLNRARGRVSRRAGRAFVLALLIASSVVAMPFMGGITQERSDHDGTALADVEDATHNQTFGIGSEDTIPHGITFSDGGSKMYMAGSNGDNVYEYDLSTAYDISTASYIQAKDISGQGTNPTDLEFKDDGTKMYVVDSTADQVSEYDLSTAYDVSTASYLQAKATQSATPQGLAFNDDGTKMYVSNGNVKEYELSTAYDVSTASQTQTYSVGEDGDLEDVMFNGDGSKMFVVGQDNANVFEYDLSTKYDIGTATYSGNSKDVSGQELYPLSSFLSSDGSKMFVVGDENNNVYGYDTDISGYDEPVSGVVTDQDGDPIGSAAVGAENSEGTTVDSTTTNSSGYYELAVPDPATYDITADDGDYVSTKTVDVPSGGISGVDFQLGPKNPDGQAVGLLEDDFGMFPADDTQLVVYERSTEYKSVEDGMSVDTWHETTWTKTETATFNWENRTRVDPVNGRYYRFELEGPRDTWEDSGILYNDTEMSGSTIWLEPDTSSTDTNGDGTSGGDGSSGTNAGTGSTTPTPDEDGTYPTVTEQQGFGPTALGTCSTLDGQDGLEVEYWDPGYETHELDANLTVDGSTTYHITKTWEDPRGYYRGCIADSMIDNATHEDDLGLNHTALDGEGEVLTSGRQSFQAPTFGPTGNAPESTGERLGLLAGVLAALGALWFGGNRYVPASSVKSWPSESISPAFGIGAPIVAVLGLDLAGGGVISAGVATGLAQIAPFAGIVGVTVGGYYALRWIRAPPSA